MKRAILLTTSSISVAIVAALATIALVGVASGNSALAATSLVNGNFETGDLTGWTVDTPDGGDATAVTSYDVGDPYCDCYEPRYLSATPHEGSYFALLTPGGLSEYTTISQPFTASNGDRVSGWVFTGETLFQSSQVGYNTYGFDDNGQVVLTDGSGTTVATLFEDSSSGDADYGSSPWKYWEYTFTDLPGESQFQIEAKQSNLGRTWDTVEPSILGLDDVKISSLASDTTKPSTSATRSVEPNEIGWNKENVTVTLKATDNEGGSGVKKITYSASGAQSIAQTDTSGDSVNVALDKEGTTILTYYATDNAGNVEDKKTLTVKIDKTAPTVKSTSQANNAISATFLESGAGIDPTTLTTNTFKVEQVKPSGNVPVSGTISYKETSKTVTFTPSRKLAKGTYQATITAGVEDKADNAMANDYTWSFSVG